MLRALWLATFFSVLIWSGIQPKDSLTWLMEVLPAIAGGVALALTWNSFRLTTLMYALILLHCIILMVGGHYTYADVPLFDWIRDWTGGTRNNYDKVGHFAQGFVPALLAREIIIRKKIIPAAFWQSFFVVCFCLAFSAFYELVEWWAALLMGQDAEAFLGTQGYIWDTQSDMALALLGSVTGLLSLSQWHDKQLQRLSSG